MKAIVAVDENWAIGNEGKLLISIPEDMKFFVKTTKGHTVIMGRKTLESFPGGKPLKHRTNVVLSATMKAETVDVDEDTTLKVIHEVDDLADALGGFESVQSKEAVVIGGGSVYKLLLPYCDTVYVTAIRHTFTADTYFPNLDADPEWEIAEESEIFNHEGIDYSFRTYRRI